MRRALGLGLMAVAIGAGAGGTLLTLDALDARDHLLDAQRGLAMFQAAVLDADPASAEEAANSARIDAEAALLLTDGPLWSIARAVPRFGATPSAVRGAAELAGASSVLAESLATDASELIASGGAELLGDGQIDAGGLRDLAARLEALPTSEVARARTELAALPESGLLGPTAAARADAVATADVVLEQLDRTTRGLTALASFVGGEEDRNYLLAIQNPGELRGTGGLISYVAELTFSAGRLSLSAGDTDVRNDIADPIARITDGGNSPRNLTPVARTQEFADRYDFNAGGALLQSVNLDPDLPTVGPVLLDLYAARGGRPLDGVVMVDPVTLASILGPTGGPITVDPALTEGVAGMPRTLTPANLAETLLITTYDTFGGLNPDRRRYEEAVTLEVLARLATGHWDPIPLAQALRRSTAERHLQLYSRDSSEQEAFERLGIAGQLQADGDADLLGIVAVNAAPNKADVHVGHQFAAEISLSPPTDAGARTSTRSTTLEVEVVNPLVADGRDTYIIGSNREVPIGTKGVDREDNALNRTWFQVWTHEETRLTELRDPVSGRALRYSNIHGDRAFDFFLETPAASTNSFVLETQGEVQLEPAGGDRLYELTLWRQSKAIPDVWDLTITAPPGWTVQEARVSGGGAPTGLGVFGTGEAAIAAVVGDSRTVSVTGAVTRDAHIVVRLRRD